MRALIHRPLAILAGVCLLWGAAHLWMGRGADAEFEQAHRGEVVVFGDSHAGDVRLPQAPRFAFPAQDLVSTWMWMDAFVRAGDADSKVKVVVLTVWPGKFLPLAERRLSGRIQEDRWGQSVLGRVGPVLGFRHMVEPAVPWRLRWRMLLNTFQLRSSIRTSGWDCQDRSIPSDYGFKMGTLVQEAPWFDGAKVSRWALGQIVRLAESQSWELVLLEHPMHRSFLDQVHPGAMADYEAALKAAAEHPRITYVDMARFPLPDSGFRDYHHLTCEGSAAVADRLEPLLEGWALSP